MSKIEHVKVTDLKPYDKNARKHPDKQIDLLVKNIKRFGFTTPLLIDKDNEIIAGHGRLIAAERIGMTELPCVRMEKLSKEEAEALRLADNKLAELAEWDMDLALDSLKGLDDDLMELTGFDKDLLIEPDEKDDEVPEVPEEPESKLGDLYELGNHRVLCGDATKIEDVEKLMDGKKSDMVFTDPPYGVDYVSRVDKDRRKEWVGIKNDNLKGDGLVTFLNDSLAYFADTTRYICCNWQSVKDFFDAYGMPNSLIVWDKKSIGLGANYRSQHEFILFYGQLSHRSETNVWGLKRDSLGSYTHPTQKPVELVTRAITNSSKQDNLIFDAFLGSGSTLIASEKTGRICYGIELDPKYVDVVVQRYVDYTGNTTIIKNGQEEVWEKQVKNK